MDPELTEEPELTEVVDALERIGLDRLVAHIAVESALATGVDGVAATIARSSSLLEEYLRLVDALRRPASAEHGRRWSPDAVGGALWSCLDATWAQRLKRHLLHATVEAQAAN